MKAIKVCTLIGLSCTMMASCSTVPAPNPVEAILVLENATVIPLSDPASPVVWENRDVVIQKGRISRIIASQAKETLTGARRIDCTGKFVLPGLVDMHVHINHPKDLMAFLLNGVTTVQNMWGYEDWRLSLMGFPDQLELRDQVRKGRRVGPTIYTAGPVFEGAPKTHPFMTAVTQKERARLEVERQKQKGYDFIKVYDHLRKEVYDAIVQTARKEKMPVKGHVPFDVGLAGVLSSGQSAIDHLTGFIDPDKAELMIPEDEIESYAGRTARANVWNCPTLVLWQKRALTDEAVEQQEQHPGMKHLSFMQRLFLGRSIKAMNASIDYVGDYRSRMLQLNLRVLAALRSAGAGVIIGTDTGNPFVFPGWSFHEELRFYEKAGFSNYEILVAATRNGARALDRLDRFGTVEEGKVADLLIVDGNPIKDISHLTAMTGVVSNGRWYSRQQLKAMLDR